MPQMEALIFDRNIRLIDLVAIAKIGLSEHLCDESAARFWHVDEHEVLSNNHNYALCFPVNRQTANSIIRK